MSEVVYTDLACVVELYKNGDLPQDEMAWKYYAAVGKVQWVHRDELKKMIVLNEAYPGSNTKKGQK